MKKKVGNRLIALVLALFMTVTMMPDMAGGGWGRRARQWGG